MSRNKKNQENKTDSAVQNKEVSKFHRNPQALADLGVEKAELSESERMDIIEEIEHEYFPNVSDSYDYQRTVEEIKFYQEQASISFIEMGKRLLRIKAHEPHGRFSEALEELGINDRTAQSFMLAVRKFHRNPQAPADLGVEKARILSVLDDDEVKELEEKNEVFGLTFDDIDRMTTRELRKTLREAREKLKTDRENLENIIKQKEEKNNELERMVRGLEPISEEKVAQEKCKEYIPEFTKKLATIQMDFIQLKRMMDEIQSIEGIDLIIIEEFQEHFNMQFNWLKDAMESFYDVYDNAHVYSREEMLEYGIIKNYGEGFKDETRRY